MSRIKSWYEKIRSAVRSPSITDAMLNFIMGAFGTIIIVGGGQKPGAAFTTSVIIGIVVSTLSRVEYLRNGYPIISLRFSLLNTLAWTAGSALIIFYCIGDCHADI
jgi:hypothetical protein